jgi:YD repeat-containing protein
MRTHMTILRKTMLRGLLAFLVVWACPSAFAQCAVADGGTEQCVYPVGKGDWTFTKCDNAFPSVERSIAWCYAGSGVWQSNSSIGWCEGGGPATASAFVLQLHGSSCGSHGNPVAACSTAWCFCDDVFQDGVPITLITANEVFRGTARDAQNNCTAEWSERVISASHQTRTCPPGYGLTSTLAGNMCVKWGSCGGPNCRGNPVEVGSGDKRQREPDYVSPAPGGLEFVRHYNSGGYFDSVQRTVMVNSDFWRHSYGSKVYAYVSNAYLMAAVQRPDGTVRMFDLSGNEKQNNDGRSWKLERIPTSGTLTGWKITTAERDVENYDAQGRLTSIATRSGFTTTLAYNTQGQLETVTDEFGRTITLGYDTAGQMTTMTDPASRQYQYAYDSLGRLTSVTYPDTRTRTYHYENSDWKFALTGITDERGVRFATYGYDVNGRATLTEHSGSDDRFTLATTSDSSTSRVVDLWDAFNTWNRYTYSKAAGTLRLTSHYIAGLNDESYTYDANGNIASKTDRRFNVTNYTYDLTRNLETSRTEAYGTAVARTITTTWHSTLRLPATITEPSGVSGVNLVTTFTYDTNGNLTKKNLTAGTNVREWNYTVNSRGQVLTINEVQPVVGPKGAQVTLLRSVVFPSTVIEVTWPCTS